MKPGTSILLLVLALNLSAQAPTPPTQPETGPGGKQGIHRGVIKNRYRQGAQEYWIYEPDKPRPATAPVVIFLHGWGGMNPLYYGAWIDHIVKRGNIVIYPRYQATLLTRREQFIPNTINAINTAFKQLQMARGHVRPDLSKVATVGHSLGGVLSASVAALAQESGLPHVRAVMSIEPGITREPVLIPMPDLKKIEAGTLLLAVAGDRDTLVQDYDAKRIYYESTRVSADNKDFVRLVTDDRGFPPLIANHRAPTAPDKEYDNGEGDLTTQQSIFGSTRPPAERTNNEVDSPRNPAVNALDYYGLWKLFDALCDAAFYGKNREYALGNTPQQRFMGKWSDGVPVKELVVTDQP